MILLSVEAVEGSGRRCREMWMVVAVVRTSGLEMGEVQSRWPGRQPPAAASRSKNNTICKKISDTNLGPGLRTAARCLLTADHAG